LPDGKWGPKIVGMRPSRSLTIRLEPHADDQPIAGWIRDERGDEQYFAGWLELLTLLERARLVAAGGPDRPGSSP
jgi:hypothetical protein